MMQTNDGLVFKNVQSFGDYVQYLLMKRGDRPGLAFYFNADEKGKDEALHTIYALTFYRGCVCKIIYTEKRTILFVSNKKKPLDTLCRDISGEDFVVSYIRAVGKLCGFPKCCIEHFVEKHKQDPDHYGLEISIDRKILSHLKGSAFTDCYYSMTNPDGERRRYMSHLMHIPCSPVCEESHEILERNKVMWEEEYDKTFIDVAVDLGYRRPRRVIT